MPKLSRLLSIILVCTSLNFTAIAQGVANDSVFLKQSIDNAVALHKAALAENLRLYNGTWYYNSYSGTKGFPFFESENLQPGDLSYDDAIYKGVPMLYDLITDDIVIDSYKHDHYIKLLADKVSYFTLGSHQFIRLEKDSTHGSTINTGFYDVLYSNKTQVFVKREKKLQQVAKAEGIEARYLVYDYYFIKRNNVFYSIESTDGLLKAFADKKDEVKTYLRKNGYRFKKDAETALVKAADFYDQLTK